ncbi:hypothetical protein HanIR_Chr11g0545831 [Helianthus annuus]|nr:hypothetical protein HanIR_Chr11g0545831 [Helianthus annuus]
MKSNLNCAITCIATLLQDLMSSVPTGTENTVTEIPKSGYRSRIYLVQYGLIRSVLVRHRYLRVKPDEYRCRTDTENTPSLVNFIPVPIPETIHLFLFLLLFINFSF